MPKTIEVNCSTGETVEREMTAEEIASIEKLQQQAEQRRIEEELAAEAKTAALESANAKLKALGLTEEEITALTK